jgi:glycogen debranching enzyme
MTSPPGHHACSVFSFAVLASGYRLVISGLMTLIARSFVPTAEIRGTRCIWRGPCAPNRNWLLARGLRRHGYNELADTLAARSRELAEAGGFNEFYNPLTGSPVGAPDFGWGTIVAVI